MFLRSDLIEYYEKLNAISERKRDHVQKHIDNLKWTDLDSSATFSGESIFKRGDIVCVVEEESVELIPVDKSLDEKSSGCSNDTFVSASSDLQTESEDDRKVEKESKTSDVHNSASLDIINANCEGDTAKISEVAQLAAENFERARRNRAKVLNEEMGMPRVEMNTTRDLPAARGNPEAILSDLERNRLKVMSSEFGFHASIPGNQTAKYQSRIETESCIANRRKVMGISECFYARADENEIISKTYLIGESIDNFERRRRIDNAESRTEDADGKRVSIIVI